jgi:hypothetical protein
MKGGSPIGANDNDKQYPALDENGEAYDWFLDGIDDWVEGREPDLGRAFGRQLMRAVRAGKAPKPIPGGKHG